ncbi:ABC transporter permease [Gordonia aquimaris]|uniref:ABC transporter permease n=1 Tax=Gordonia aquimaris TaxID=2984863 RepID=A0A9X3D236_9ACTN|nr:ABC transporter permease [Gordonia aquimaris]MCX2963229.1 ABC transporter permease [Gordonia aquimaris]
MSIATQTDPDQDIGPARTRTKTVQSILERFALVILTFGVFVFFATWPQTSATFLSIDNLQNVAANQSALVLAALASLFPLVCGEFDLSVGAVATTTHIVVASFAASGWSLPVAIVMGLLVGLVVGGINAVLVTRVGVNGIITTLGMATLLTGLVTWGTGGVNIVEGIPRSLTDVGTMAIIGIPALTIAASVAGGLVAYFFALTPPGRRLTMIGSNRRAADLVGISVQRHVASAFVLSALFASLAGIALLARNGIASPQAGGTAFTLQALSAVFLGATAIWPGRFNVLGTFVAVFFIAISVAGLSLAGAAGWVSDVFTGAALVIAVAASTLVGRRHRS